MRLFILSIVALMLAGCASDTTVRTDWFTYQRKGRCAPDTNTKPSWQERVDRAREKDVQPVKEEEPADVPAPPTACCPSPLQKVIAGLNPC